MTSLFFTLCLENAKTKFITQFFTLKKSKQVDYSAKYFFWVTFKVFNKTEKVGECYSLGRRGRGGWLTLSEHTGQSVKSYSIIPTSGSKCTLEMLLWGVIGLI